MEIRRVGNRVKFYRSVGSVQTMIGSIRAIDLECSAELLAKLSADEKGQMEAYFRGTRTRLVTEAMSCAIDSMQYVVEHADRLTQAETQALIEECLRTASVL